MWEASFLSLESFAILLPLWVGSGVLPMAVFLFFICSTLSLFSDSSDAVLSWPFFHSFLAIVPLFFSSIFICSMSLCYLIDGEIMTYDLIHLWRETAHIAVLMFVYWVLLLSFR